MEDVPDPERNSPSPQPTSSLPTLPFPKGTETLLFVDDDPLIRDMLCDMFQRLGYTVHLASDGLAAIERFQKLQGLVDAVLLDLSMPRMGGVECLKCPRKSPPTFEYSSPADTTWRKNPTNSDCSAHGV